MNVTLDAILLVVFLFNFIIVHPFSWGAANREIYFSILFLIPFLYLLIRNEKIRFILLLLLILFIYVGATVFAIVSRHQSVPWKFSHDSVFQNEIAGRMLFEGKNPYKETYINSGLEQFQFEGDELNPALYNLVTLPFLLIFNTILQPIVGTVLGYFDGRFIYLLSLSIFLWLLNRRFQNSQSRNLLFIIFFLNPMTARHFADGRTDFFVTFLLFTATYYLQNKRYLISGLTLGLALTTKLTAWLILPYLFMYLFRHNRTAVTKVFIPCTIITTILFAPFIAWDANAFFTSTIVFFFGGGIQSYPVSGYGFSKILLSLGFLSTPYDFFPFLIFQIFFCVPLLLYQFLMQPAMNKIGDVFNRYALFLLVFWFFSHHFQDNYIIYLTQIFTLGYFLNETTIIKGTERYPSMV